MTASLRRSIALLIAFEMLLLVIAFVGFGTQGDPGQDTPIAFGVVLVVILGTGNVLGLLTAVLVLAVTLSRRRRSP